MAEESHSDGDRKKVWELIKDIKVALMVTKSDRDHLRGRPMAAMNDDFDGDLWFASRAGTLKLEEVAEHAQVLLAYAEPKNQDYVSVSGTASIVRDEGKAKTLWRESMRVWFPAGPEDPGFVLIKVHVESAEFWDSPSSAWVYAYGYAKARLTGESPEKLGENRIVNF